MPGASWPGLVEHRVVHGLVLRLARLGVWVSLRGEVLIERDNLVGTAGDGASERQAADGAPASTHLTSVPRGDALHPLQLLRGRAMAPARR